MSKTFNIVSKEGYVRVCEDKCATCIFHPGNRMQLQPGRVKDLVETARRDREAGSIVCHSTLDKDEQAICKGFYDLEPKPDLLQVAQRLDRIMWHDTTVQVPAP